MFLHILKIIFIILEVVVVFNLMIIVHELGHFLAARWRGLVVEKFGIWFGKPIWKKTINGVQYSLGSIPAGGFVALPQMAPMEAVEGKSDISRENLPPVSALDKSIVAIAGPLFSFGLAIIFATIVWIVGRPVSKAETSTIIGYVMPGSPAEQAGIQPGDKVLEVDGLPVSKFGGMGDSISWRIVRSEGERIPFKIERNGEIQTLYPKPIIPKQSMWSRKSLRQIQILPAGTPMIAKVDPGSAAEKSGLKMNDLITEVNGQKLLSYDAISEYALKHPDEALLLTVMRENETHHIKLETAGATIEKVMKDSPADRAGLKPNDVITGVNELKVTHFSRLTDYIRSHANEKLSFAVERGTEKLNVELIPAIPEGQSTPMIGILWNNDGITLDQMGPTDILHPNPGEQIHAGVMTMVNTFGALISRKSDVKLQHMSGPVTIMRVYYMMFENKDGWRMALWFSVVLNVNLALLNLLPVPVLDGGHIVLAMIEAIRRKPANIRFLEMVQSGCALLLIGFMLYIAFFDVQDLPWREKDAIKFVPPNPTTIQK